MDAESYKIDDWVDVEHCVYNALTDEPKNLTDHRIAHFISRLTATLVENGTIAPDQVEEFLLSCRG
jgi:hypothetical protein